jgi:hypothetical protein
MEPGLVSADNLLACRYECKYLVSHAAAAEIRRFIQPFMVPDAYARRRAGYRYPICSLYFDTLGLDLYRQTAAGEKNRFKIRVRSYSDDAAVPVFLEVKRRVTDVILKRRAKLPRDVATEMLTTGDSLGLEGSTSDLLADLHFFTGHVRVASARPFLRIRYVREAYEACGGDPLRITLDTDIAWRPTSMPEFGLNGRGWRSASVPGTVLEIKFTDRYPGWVAEMIRAFDLQRESVAKYVVSVDTLFGRAAEGAVEAGETPRPRLGWDGRPFWAQEV